MLASAPKTSAESTRGKGRNRAPTSSIPDSRFDVARSELGIQRAGGLFNQGVREWSGRFEKIRGVMSTYQRPGVHAVTLHYLKVASEVTDATDGAAVVATMKRTPTDDPLFGKEEIREDGRKLRDFFLFRVKSRRSRRGHGISTNW